MSRIRNDRPHVNNARPCKSEAYYKAWGRRHDYCQACGQPEGRVCLETHHLIKSGRAHEGCNLLRVCRRCHNLAEGLDVREGGVILPKLSLGASLTLKRFREPEEWNPDRLRELRLSNIPDLEPVPFHFERDYRWNRTDLWLPEEWVAK